MADPDRVDEYERIFDEVAYQLSTARAAGLDRPDDARAALKRVRDLVAEADSLAAMVAARRKESPEG